MLVWWTAAVLLAATGLSEVSAANASELLLKAAPAGRIIGGTEATSTEFPHQVSIDGICGGSIIGRQWVLTAAHCIKRRWKYVKVFHGSNERQKQRLKLSFKFMVHPMFMKVPESLAYDFALVKINSHFAYNKFTRPIKLAPANYTPSGIAVVSGWGSTRPSRSRSYPKILRKVKVPIVNDSKCVRIFDKLRKETGDAYCRIDAKTMVCAGGSSKGGYDACAGDSGGPLSQKLDGRDVLVGVVSWGFGCGRAGIPGVYARVSAVRQWIRDETGI